MTKELTAGTIHHMLLEFKITHEKDYKVSMPSNKSLFLNLITALLPSSSTYTSNPSSGRSRGVASRGKNRADQKKGYNKVKK